MVVTLHYCSIYHGPLPLTNVLDRRTRCVQATEVDVTERYRWWAHLSA